MTTIKAISLWQPWASLWLSANKLHETRTCETMYRGPLLVHAGKKIVHDVDSDLEDILLSEYGGHWGMDLPTGALIGMVTLIDCIPTGQLAVDHLDADQNIDRACGNFGPDRFAWRRGNYWIFREPVPYSGHQRIFNVPRDAVCGAIAKAREDRKSTRLNSSHVD